MKKQTMVAVAAAVGILLIGGVSFGQDPELPFAWKGEGKATIIGGEGEEDIEFDFDLKVDAEGAVSGQTSTDDGQAKIERFYYGEEIKAQYPALASRKVIVILSIESSDTPLLAILNGQALGDKHFYGELRLARKNAEGMKEALDLGNKAATAFSAEGLPSGLKKALNESAPMGYFGIKGKRVADQ